MECAFANRGGSLNWLSSQFQAETSELLTALAMNLGRPLSALETLQQGLIEQRKNFLRQFWLFYRRRSAFGNFAFL